MALASYLIDVFERRYGVAEVAFDGTFHFVLGDADGAQPVDQRSYALRAVDAFMVAVGDLGAPFGFAQHVVIVVHQPSYGTHAHG